MLYMYRAIASMYMYRRYVRVHVLLQMKAIVLVTLFNVPKVGQKGIGVIDNETLKTNEK